MQIHMETLPSYHSLVVQVFNRKFRLTDQLLLMFVPKKNFTNLITLIVIRLQVSIPSIGISENSTH